MGPVHDQARCSLQSRPTLDLVHPRPSLSHASPDFETKSTRSTLSPRALFWPISFAKLFNN